MNERQNWYTFWPYRFFFNFFVSISMKTISIVSNGNHKRICRHKPRCDGFSISLFNFKHAVQTSHLRLMDIDDCLSTPVCAFVLNRSPLDILKCNAHKRTQNIEKYAHTAKSSELWLRETLWKHLICAFQTQTLQWIKFLN